MTRGSYSILMEDHWNRLNGEDYAGGSSASMILRPFSFVDRSDPTGTLQWLVDILAVLEDEQFTRATNMVNNVNFNNGIQRLVLDGTSNAYFNNTRNRSRQTELVINDCRDYINQSTNRLLRYSPNLNVTPENNEYKDKIGARVSKRVIDNIFYLNDAPNFCREIIQEAKIAGEAFAFIDYDPYKGDISKAFKDAMAQSQSAAISSGADFQYDAEKGTFQNASGEIVSVDFIKRTGEVNWVHPLPWFVFHEPAFRWKDVNYIFYGTIRHIDEVKAENPGIDIGAMKPIQVSKAREGFNGPAFKYGEYVVEYKFYHRRMPFLDGGWYCKFVDGVLLKSEKPKECDAELPVARFTDFDDPINAHGISFLEDLKPPLVLQNKMYGLMYRNLAIANHPKLLVPNGSCNISSMANGPLVVEYEYPMKPEIMTFQSNGSDIFTVSEKFGQKIAALSGTFDISRGEALPNARAASILNFYQEQEEQRESQQIKKYSSFIEKIGRLSLGKAGSWYEADDGRTLRVVGARNYYKVRKLDDISKLNGPYQIKVERTTALSESKQGRIDQIVSISSVPISTSPLDASTPGIFTREQILQMLEIADTPTFFEMATAAVEKQESENEDMFEGFDVEAPQPWEAHIVCWNVMFQFIQSREFMDTQGLPMEVRQKVLDHLLAHELFMYQQAMKSLAFCEGLMKNLYYPCILQIGPNAIQPQFKPTIAQIMMMHQMPPAVPGNTQPPVAGDPNAPGGEQPPIPGETAPDAGPQKDAMPTGDAPQGDKLSSQVPPDNQPVVQ